MESNKNASLFQIAYIAIAAITALVTIVAIIRGSGVRLYYLTTGATYILTALLMTAMVSAGKIEATREQITTAANGLKPLMESLELTSLLNKLTHLLIPLYLIIELIYTLNISRIIYKIPVIGDAIMGVISPANSILFYLFLLMLLTLFAHAKFENLAFYLGAYTAISAFDFIFNFLNSFFNSGGYFTSLSTLLFFGYLFCVFFPYLKINTSK